MMSDCAKIPVAFLSLSDSMVKGFHPSGSKWNCPIKPEKTDRYQ